MSENQEEQPLYTVSYFSCGNSRPRIIHVSRPTRMPCQTPSWTEFLICPVCTFEFAADLRLPITLRCSHTICKKCLASIQHCPFDQTTITKELDGMPINYALLQLVSTSAGSNIADPEILPTTVQSLSADDLQCYKLAKGCIEKLALNLKPSGKVAGLFSRPMQRKLVTLINCQLVEDEGRSRLIRAARALGERTVTELMLHHQNPNQLSSNLWAAVRSRGCQFLGPAMQEAVLNFILTALEDGASLCRKDLVMFVVEKMENSFAQASKTNIGHVIQLLYRASCFTVTKRNGDSSMMQLQEEFRTYKSLRKEHDAQIVLIATEAGLRIAPDQWSSLLYGNQEHKSDMQSLIDKQQSPQSFGQSIQELMVALQRTGDPANLSALRIHMTSLAAIEASEANIAPTWKECAEAVESTKLVVNGLVDYVLNHCNRKSSDSSHISSYKISMCREFSVRGKCSRGSKCTFAHSDEELVRYQLKLKKNDNRSQAKGSSSRSSNSGSSFNKSSPHQTPAKSPQHFVSTFPTDISSRSTPNMSQNQMSLKEPFQSPPSVSHMNNRFAYNGSNFGGSPVVTGYHDNYRTPMSPQQFQTQSRFSSGNNNPYSYSSNQMPLSQSPSSYFQADQTRNDSGFFGDSGKCNTSMMWRSGCVDKIENKSPTNRSELSELELRSMMMYRNQAADENQTPRVDQMKNVPGLQCNTLQSLDSAPMTNNRWFEVLPSTVNYEAMGSNQPAGPQARPWSETQSTVFKRFEALRTSGSGQDAMAKMAPMGDANSRMNVMSNESTSSQAWTFDMNQAQALTAPRRPLFDRQQKNRLWMEPKQNWTEGSSDDFSFSSED